MDPFTLAMLGAAGVGLGQAAYNAFAPNSAARANRDALRLLQERESQGALGLTAGEQRSLYSQLYDPARGYADQARQGYERVAAASGDQSGAQLAQLRREAGQRTGEAAGAAALGVSMADERARQRQQDEIRQRLAAQQAYRQDRASAVFSGLGQAAGAAGALAGSPPEVTRSMNLSPAQYIEWLKKNDPAGYWALVNSVYGGQPAQTGLMSAGLGR